MQHADVNTAPPKHTPSTVPDALASITRRPKRSFLIYAFCGMGTATVVAYCVIGTLDNSIATSPRTLFNGGVAVVCGSILDLDTAKGNAVMPLIT